MRVGIVSSSFWPLIGGVEVYLRQLAKELVAAGHELTVATRFVRRRKGTKKMLTSVEPGQSYCEDGATVHVLSAGWLSRQLLRPVYRLHFYRSTEKAAVALFSAVFFRQLGHLLKDCELLHYSGTGRELLGYVVSRLAQKNNVPFVIMPHLHVGSWGDSELDISLYKQADMIITSTNFENSFLMSKGIVKNRVSVVGEGVYVKGSGDAQRFRKKYNLGGSEPIILFVGRKAIYKGYPLLLKAAPLVWRNIPDARFVFIGPQEELPAHFKGRLNSLLSDSRVLNLGSVSDEEKEDAYAASDIFCLPSLAESFGIAYVEAWRYSKPVVALNIPTLRELIGDMQGGFLVQPTPVAVAEALIALLKDSDLSQRLGNLGFEKSQKYSWDKITPRIIQAYRQAKINQEERIGLR